MQNNKLSLKTTIIFAMVLASLVLLVGCGTDLAAESIATGQPVSIDTMLERPSNFQQWTLATGTVTTFSTQGNVSLIGIVDNEHIMQCRNLDCVGSKIYSLNVSGLADPEPGDVITMYGYFEQQDTHQIFMITNYSVDSNVITFLR